MMTPTSHKTTAPHLQTGLLLGKLKRKTGALIEKEKLQGYVLEIKFKIGILYLWNYQISDTLPCYSFKIIAEQEKRESTSREEFETASATELQPRVQEACTQTLRNNKNVAVQFRAKSTARGKLTIRFVKWAKSNALAFICKQNFLMILQVSKLLSPRKVREHNALSSRSLPHQHPSQVTKKSQTLKRRWMQMTIPHTFLTRMMRWTKMTSLMTWTIACTSKLQIARH